MSEQHDRCVLCGHPSGLYYAECIVCFGVAMAALDEAGA